MSEPLKLYQLEASPNCMKARIALRFKNLSYEAVSVDPKDRGAVVRISGQPLTPVLLHGDRVIFDSAAILRYLEANFADAPRLFSADYGAMKQIEEWESFSRRELGECVGLVFGQLMSPSADTSVTDRASRLLHERTARIEERLRGSAWLVGDAMTAADVSAAPPVWYGCKPRREVPWRGILDFFAAHFDLGPDRPRTREWVERVMAHIL